MRSLNKKLLRDLWHIKGQALAIAAVMACGVTIMVMTFGAMKSLQETRDLYYENYRFAQVFSQLKRAPSRVAQDISALPGIAAVETRITHYAQLDISDLARPAAAYLVSLPDYGTSSLNRIALRQGRLPAPGHDELVMSENMANALGYAPGRQIGVNLRGRNRNFTVVGIALSPEFVYVLGPGQIMPDDKAFGIMWLNRSIMEAAFDLTGAFNDVSVLLAPGASEYAAIGQLDLLLARYGGTAAYGRADQTSHAFIAQELEQLKTISFVIPPIFLGVAAFLIHMVMSRLIDTEREVIGLLKSFGYTNQEIGGHYLKFTMVIAGVGILIGSIAGISLGQWMTQLYQDYFRFPFLEYRLDRIVFSAAVAISLAAAIAGTISSVLRAVRLAPAMAMQPPAPALYRRSFIERLGWDRIISMPTHMIARHIERWPARAILTSFGVATATMLLIGLLFFFDSIDELVDSFYFRSNRQGVVIGLIDQRNERLRFDIARLPGVLAVEPTLQLAAKLKHGQFSQRLGITGVEPNTQFRVFADISGRAFSLPASGIVLSEKLADILQAHRGDRVEVEILEGRRHAASIPVSAIISEHVGLSAFMTRQALASLGGESGVTSILASIDERGEAELLRRLKDFPAVGSISTRAQAVASLREIMARSMVIVINFYIGLGAVIVFGVVYNAARISLSERGRELASLRVLGFRKSEVVYILLGELALLILAALPVGCALGYGLAYVMSHAMETKLFRVPFIVDRSTYGLAVAVVIIAASASAIAVARRISKLDLISVLKTRE